MSLTHSRVNFDPWMISVEIDRLIDALSATAPGGRLAGWEREREREKETERERERETVD